jgi:hypothetical protein
MPPKQFQYRRSPPNAAESVAQDGKASPYNKMTNGPSEEGRSSAHEKPITMSDHMEQLIGKDLSIQPATSGAEVTPDHYWKRRAYPEQLRAAAAVTTAAPRNAASLVHGDERQITRVAQVISPRHSTSNPGVEPISPPSGAPQSHGSPPGDPIARFLDAQKRHQQQAAADGKGGPPPGLSPLDYVKNKIVEEMKKGDGPSSDYVKNKIAEELKKGEAASQAAKRSLSGEGQPSQQQPSTSNNGDRESAESPRKKMRLEALENELPDSPGSGEMVIDETARPDSVSSQKTASPAPSQPQPPSASATGASAAAAAAGSGSKYEPLSDDE